MRLGGLTYSRLQGILLSFFFGMVGAGVFLLVLVLSNGYYWGLEPSRALRLVWSYPSIISKHSARLGDLVYEVSEITTDVDDLEGDVEEFQSTVEFVRYGDSFSITTADRDVVGLNTKRYLTVLNDVRTVQPYVSMRPDAVQVSDLTGPNDLITLKDKVLFIGPDQFWSIERKQ